MSALDPRTPVIAGVGQVTVRDGGPDLDRTPLAMMQAAVEAAGADAGTTALLGEARLWIASAGVFRYTDPARLVAHRWGVVEAQTRLTNFGGNLPQAALAHVAASIGAGELDVGVVLGGEADRNRRLLAASGEHLDSTGPDEQPAPRFGSETPIPNEIELAVGAGVPAVSYALFESALRAERAETLAENTRILGELWAGFADVARHNRHAWNREGDDAARIPAISADNRMVATPYTKAMCANPQVDMGAAVIVCSLERARRHGVDESQLVFPCSSATGHDTVELLARDALHTSHAIAPTGAAALAHAGLGIDDLAHVDLYACFPSIVRMTATALGLAHDRPLTVTGGLNYGGGPLNNATLHAVATMVERLRADPTAHGLVHGNGGMATKHSIGVYSAVPPAQPFADLDAQSDIDHRARVPAPDHEGEATVAAATVIHDRDGPTAALAVLTTPDGGRAFARSAAPDVLEAVTTSETVGRSGRRLADGTLVLD
ncbi:MAG: hypothetical protein OES57_05885 [Acidimicrobiia bacterium]|nr:hypothetical protein [Acidimicrobiia bacterium]